MANTTAPAFWGSDNDVQTEKLLAFLSAVYTVRDAGRLQAFLTIDLKKLVEVTGFMILLTGNCQQEIIPYLIHFDEGKEPDENVWSGQQSRPPSLTGGFLGEVLQADKPVFRSISDLMRMPERPEFITRYRINNFKGIMGSNLVADEEKIGVLLLFAANPEALEINSDLLNQYIMPGVANAVRNSTFYGILADENKSKDELIGFMKRLQGVRERGELEGVLKQDFSKMGFIREACLFLNLNREPQGAIVQLKSSSENTVGRGRIRLPEYYDAGDDFLQLVKSLNRPHIFKLSDLLNLRNVPDYIRYWDSLDFKSFLAVPIFIGNSLAGLITLVNSGQTVWPQLHLQTVAQMAERVAATCVQIQKWQETVEKLNDLNRFKEQLEIEKSYLQEEIQIAHNSELVGTSNCIKQVYHLISQVAPTNSSVLILGETGTGKELIARAIHNGSSRRDKVMIKVNCAALPTNLIESELFGHERGSFTGAMERRIGKFELANNSTIFLDEIGEMPMALQVKLLRALQEKEIERVGGKTSIKTDVRVIAATNRDLYKEVQAGNFRSDLYFRLNVFPIIISPLRDHKDDIPVLINHFIQKYANKLTVSKVHFTSRAIKQMVAYNWPGNVRELEHLVERTILVNKGKSINEVFLPATSGADLDVPLQNKDVKTIDEVEREHIIAVLRMVNGKVSGVGGAAEMLKIPSTTLSSKIRRLKIKKEVNRPE